MDLDLLLEKERKKKTGFFDFALVFFFFQTDASLACEEPQTDSRHQDVNYLFRRIQHQKQINPPHWLLVKIQFVSLLLAIIVRLEFDIVELIAGC